MRAQEQRRKPDAPRTIGGIGYAPPGRDVEILRMALPWAAASVGWAHVERETGVPAGTLADFARGVQHGMRKDWFDCLWTWIFHRNAETPQKRDGKGR